MSSEPRQPTEEEMRAAYEAELKRLRVEHVLIDNVAALVNLGMRRTGLVPGTEEERDPAQVRLAIESLRALLPVLEQAAPAQIGAIRDAVSQLQLAFVRIGGPPAPGFRNRGLRTPGAPVRPAHRIPARSPRRTRHLSPSPASPASPGRRSAAAASGCRVSPAPTSRRGTSSPPRTLHSRRSGPPLDHG